MTDSQIENSSFEAQDHREKCSQELWDKLREMKPELRPEKLLRDLWNLSFHSIFLVRSNKKGSSYSAQVKEILHGSWLQQDKINGWSMVDLDFLIYPEDPLSIVN